MLLYRYLGFALFLLLATLHPVHAGNQPVYGSLLVSPNAQLVFHASENRHCLILKLSTETAIKQWDESMHEGMYFWYGDSFLLRASSLGIEKISVFENKRTVLWKSPGVFFDAAFNPKFKLLLFSTGFNGVFAFDLTNDSATFMEGTEKIMQNRVYSHPDSNHVALSWQPDLSNPNVNLLNISLNADQPAMVLVNKPGAHIFPVSGAYLVNTAGDHFVLYDHQGEVLREFNTSTSFHSLSPNYLADFVSIKTSSFAIVLLNSFSGTGQVFYESGDFYSLKLDEKILLCDYLPESSLLYPNSFVLADSQSIQIRSVYGNLLSYIPLKTLYLRENETYLQSASARVTRSQPQILQIGATKKIHLPSPIRVVHESKPYLFVGLANGSVFQYSLNGDSLMRYDPFSETIRAVCRIKNNLYCAARGRIVRFTVNSKEEAQVFIGHDGPIVHLAAFKEHYLESWGVYDQRLMLRDSSGRILWNKTQVVNLEASGSGNLLREKDYQVIAQKEKEKVELKVQNSFGGAVLSLAMSHDNKTMAILNESEGMIRLVDLQTGLSYRDILHDDLHGSVRITFSDDDLHILVNQGFQFLRFDRESGTCIQQQKIAFKNIGALNLAGDWSNKTQSFRQLNMHMQYNCTDLLLTHKNSGDFFSFANLESYGAGIIYDFVFDGSKQIFIYGANKRYIYNLDNQKTILLSDRFQGKIINSLSSHVRFSPSSKLSSSIEGDQLQLVIWDNKTGLARWQGPEYVLGYDFIDEDHVLCLELSSQKRIKYVVYTIGKSVPDQEFVSPYKMNRSSELSVFELSKDKKRAAFGTTLGDVFVLDIEQNQLLYENKRFATYAYSFNCEAGGRYVVFPEKQGVFLLDLKSMSTRRIAARNYPLSARFQENARGLYYISENNSLIYMDLETGIEKTLYSGNHELSIKHLDKTGILLQDRSDNTTDWIYLDPEGRQLVDNEFVKAFTGVTPIFQSSVSPMASVIVWRTLEFSTDQSKAINQFWRWNPNTKKQEKLFHVDTRYLDENFYSGAIKTIFSGDVENWKTQRRKNFFSEFLRYTTAQHPREGHLAFGYDDSEITVYDAKNKSTHLIDWWNDDHGTISSLNFIRDTLFLGTAQGHVAYSVYPYKQVSWLTKSFSCKIDAIVEQGSQLAIITECGELSWLPALYAPQAAHLRYIGDGEILCYTDSGYYYSTSPDLNRVAFTYAKQVFPHEEFDLEYNRPDKVYALMPVNDPDFQLLLDDASLRRYTRYSKKYGSLDLGGIWKTDPSWKQAVPAISEQAEIHLPLHIQGPKSSSFRLIILVNNVLQNELQVKSDALGKYSQSIPIHLMEGLNEIKVLIVDAQGRRSPGEIARCRLHKTVQMHRRFVLAIGMNEYRDSSKNLHYCLNDARSIEKALQTDQFIYLSDTLFNKQFTPEALKASLAKIKAMASINDEFILFFAGHGMLDRKHDFYLSHYSSVFSANPTGILYTDLLDWISELPMQKKLLLIDACHSGEVDDQDTLSTFFAAKPAGKDKRGIIEIDETGAGNRGNSFMLMKHIFSDYSLGNGISVIAASGGFESAIESSSLRNGVFTYCLLEALKEPGADRNADGYLSVAEWNRYVSARVVELTDGRQQPSARQMNYKLNWELVSY